MDNAGIVIRLHASDEAVDWHVEQPYQLSFDDILVSTTYIFIRFACLLISNTASLVLILMLLLSSFLAVSCSCFILQDAIYQIANDDSVQAFECKPWS